MSLTYNYLTYLNHCYITFTSSYMVLPDGGLLCRVDIAPRSPNKDTAVNPSSGDSLLCDFECTECDCVSTDWVSCESTEANPESPVSRIAGFVVS